MAEEEAKEVVATPLLLKSHSHVFSTTMAFVSSMALKCAIDLGISDAIHRKGGRPVTLQELITELDLPPGRADCLSRLMRLLVHEGYFAKGIITTGDGGDVEGYVLTPASLHLIGRSATSLTKFVHHPSTIAACLSLSAWFRFRHASLQQPTTPFHTANGAPLYEYAGKDPEFNENFNAAVSHDAQLIATELVAKFRSVLGGVRSLVDVGGGNGALARAINEAFPHIGCRVLELPHVVEEQLTRPTKARVGADRVTYVAGDMFEHIPQADVVLLKYVLHCYRDEDCVKVLRLCKKAIPPKADGGRVMLVEMVIDFSVDASEMVVKNQLLMDMILVVDTEGKERTEKEWADIFVEAGFTGGYKMTPIMDDFLCLIEVFP